MKDQGNQMTYCHRIAALAATSLLALVVPAAALAHPSVYSTTALMNKTQEVQTITVNATGGTFKPSAGADAVDFDATALEVQLALEQDPAIGIGNVDVTGADGGPFTVKWVGAKISTNEASIAPDAALLTGGAGTAVQADVTDGGTAITFADDSTGATLPTQEYYVIAEHGYAPLLKETNGSQEGGMLNLKRLPGTYRTSGGMTGADWLTFAAAQTDVQAHPVCEGVSDLQSSANILAANENPAQPFWNYVPFTKSSSNIADDPADWTDVLQTVLDTNLGAGTYDATNTAAEFETACDGLGGVYRPADAAGATSPIYSAALSDETTPLNSQITTLTSEKTALTNDKATLTSDKDTLTKDKATLQSTIDDLNKQIEDLKAQVGDLQDAALNVAPVTRRLRVGDATMLVTGNAKTKVTIRVTVTKAAAKKLGLRSTVLGTKVVTIGANGAVIAEPTFSLKVRKVLARHTVGATVTARGGGDTDTVKVTLVG
ncbi:MAG: hypothetical protein KDC46_13995 [Thermoleophilia bacterium]|nr:hypothetical protein [Thermoleophilia bacterium]